MRIAQILNGRIHWIFEAESIPKWPPDPQGNPVVLIDVTNREANEGDGYDAEADAVTPFEELIEEAAEEPVEETTEKTLDAKIESILAERLEALLPAKIEEVLQAELAKPESGLSLKIGKAALAEMAERGV